jgi:type IV pilus assembly protein PilC
VEGGSALSEALAKHPRVFDKLYVNMVKAGEAGGVLDQILARLAEYMEKSVKLRQKIIGALVYPAAVITIAGGILAFILIYIIPKFRQMFEEMDIGTLPVPTEILISISTMLAHYWYVIILFIALVISVFYLIGKTPKGRYTIDMIKLKFPVMGMIISKAAVSRFCRTFGTLIQSGVPILNALSIIKGATGNAVMAAAVENVHNSIREGDTIAEPLRHSGVFDDLVVNMIQVGEETGELDKMLLKVADTYEGEVDTLVGALMSLLEPMLIIGMGLTVGFIVISLFLPLIAIMERIR